MPDGFAGSILNLEPGTEYECRFHLTDPDGVTGEASHVVRVTTRTEPQPYEGGRTLHVYPPDHEGPREEPSFTRLLQAYYGAGLGDWSVVWERRAQPGDPILVLCAAILNDAPAPLRAGTPPALRVVIERCLDKDPRRRYANGAAVQIALGIAAHDRDTTDQEPATGTRADEPRLVLSISRRRALRVAAGLIIIGSSALPAWHSLQRAPAQRTLAVLPLQNVADDRDLEYLCEGIAGSLIRQISRLRSLSVTPLESVLYLKGSHVDPAAAGRQLGVETILAGELVRSGTRLQITARLVDAPTGRPLWTRQYDIESAELLDVQDAIAGAIMDEGLRVRLTADERQRLVRHPTTDADAYDLYLQAGYFQRRGTEDDYLYSRELLQRAIVRDPRFAVAYAALAGNYGMMVTDGFERPSDGWAQVNKYMRQALAIDEDLPEAHAYAHSLGR